jgi:hypothetical protein
MRALFFLFFLVCIVRAQPIYRRITANPDKFRVNPDKFRVNPDKFRVLSTGSLT